jgi:hypothetical protein
MYTPKIIRIGDITYAIKRMEEAKRKGLLNDKDLDIIEMKIKLAIDSLRAVDNIINAKMLSYEKRLRTIENKNREVLLAIKKERKELVRIKTENKPQHNEEYGATKEEKELLAILELRAKRYAEKEKEIKEARRLKKDWLS